MKGRAKGTVTGQVIAVHCIICIRLILHFVGHGALHRVPLLARLVLAHSVRQLILRLRRNGRA